MLSQDTPYRFWSDPTPPLSISRSCYGACDVEKNLERRVSLTNLFSQNNTAQSGPHPRHPACMIRACVQHRPQVHTPPGAKKEIKSKSEKKRQQTLSQTGRRQSKTFSPPPSPGKVPLYAYVRQRRRVALNWQLAVHSHLTLHNASILRVMAV